MTLVRLQFVLGAGWTSRLIAWWGSGYSGFSHVDAVLDDGSLVGARYDDVGGKPPGVQRRPAGYEKWKRRVVVTFPHTEAIYPMWEKGLLARVGAPYDPFDIIGLILGIPLSSPGHWICSACQSDELQSVMLLPSLPIPPQQITPNTLYIRALDAGALLE